MNSFPKLITSLAVAYLTTSGFPLTQLAATAGEGLANPAMEATNRSGASQFQLIIQRNIFDPDRGRAEPNRERPPHIETFSFRGAAEKMGKGFDAFFAGDGAPTSGIVAVNHEINGFIVQEIKLSEVKLMDSNHKVVILKDQNGMTRREGGPWIKVFVPPSYGSSDPTRKTVDNAQYATGLAAATDDNAGANSGGQNRNSGGNDTGGGLSTTPAETTGPPAPINPAMLARIQARRPQEN
ncbi:MAG: hypothetical protein ABSG04_05240 [Verrucomicrobiota bacterium]